MRISIAPDARLSKNGLARANWRTTRRLVKEAREVAYYLAIEQADGRWTMPDQVEISIVSYYARRPMDFDGLACVCGPSIDGMVDAGIMRDDSPDVVAAYTMRHQKVDTVDEVRVEIGVEPVSK